MLNFVKIELRGFKSFADKVEIPFQEGVTAIIGPNGCGKSNVADAIRWTLGERSAKSLRGKSMQDVIFNGTEKRKGMSYCEVSLTFDNTNEKIFKGISFDEVVITRKMDRSGSSEYFINGNRCRLADITSLLHDTGIGKEGYSIIGQGRVQEIISGKPEDRRQIFEEAAGISKFRAERTESERKLERTRENLKTINEVIYEIEKQIKPLEKQAEQAQKYNELKEKLRYYELNHYVYQFERNQETKEKIKLRLENYTHDIKVNELKFGDSSKKYDELLLELQKVDREFESVSNELTALKVDATKFEGDLALFREKLQNLNDSKQRTEEDLAELDTRIVENQKAIDIANQNKDEKFAEYLRASKELEDAEKKYKIVMQSADDQESQLAKSNKDFIDAMNQLEELRSSQGSIMEQQGIASQRAQSLKDIISEKKRDYAEAKTNFSIAEGKVNSYKAKLKELSEKYNEALSNKKEAEDSISSYREDLKVFQEKLAGYRASLKLQESIKNDYAGYQDSVRLLMKDSNSDEFVSSRVWGVVASVIDVPEKYQAAIEYSLGGNMQNVLVETERDAADLITYLKRKGYGRVTFRPASSTRPQTIEPAFRGILNEPGVEGIAANLIAYDKKFDCFMQTLLGGTVVVNNIDNATNLYRKYNRQVKLVTLEGDVFTRGGEITGGSRRGQMSSLLAQDKTIDTIKENIAKYEKREQMAQEQLSEVSDTINAAVKQMEDAQKEIGDIRAELGAEISKYNLAKEAFERLEGELKTNQEDLDLVNSDIEGIKNKLSSITELEQLAASKREEYQMLLDSQTSSEDGERKKERQAANQAVMDAKVRSTQLKSELDNSDAELSRLIHSKESFESDKIELVAEIKGYQSQIDDMTKTPEKTNFTEEDKKRIDMLTEEKDKLSQRKSDITEEIKTVDAEKTALSEEKNGLIESKTRNENMLENLENTMLNQQQYILEEYDMTYQGCLEIKDEAFEDQGSGNEIKIIKGEITKLGEINPLALETLKETRERLDEQTTQRDDIQKAHDDIVAIIEELTQEMESKFLAAFNQINENFKDTFYKLFGGGKGELKLDTSETDDVLECGINIMAQPPGKKIQGIHLLSGGEQALTAIAILFAILMLKPMPFCVLDEIEAALDDSNINNFAEFLKKFSDFTQFIVITHRKPTMAHADSIFGVTMQEQGVTKLVSVTFEEAVKHATKD
ncbi:MAG: chromosome segregation protein SMC [Clostridia bacterium]|nr:chromosome segregation protein SMC [Clostridia bacterium]